MRPSRGYSTSIQFITTTSTSGSAPGLDRGGTRTDTSTGPAGRVPAGMDGRTISLLPSWLFQSALPTTWPATEMST